MVAVLVAQLVACSQDSSLSERRPATRDAPRFQRQLDWAGRGLWLKADTHAHTTFSDGQESVSRVVASAASFGCDVVAITDHGDFDLEAATPEYFAAIHAARQMHPELIVLAGIEWNVPPSGGDEHAVVLVMPSEDEARVLSEFQERFDDWKRPPGQTPDAAAALRWLAAQTAADEARPVIIYEHPSRKDLVSESNAADVQTWRQVNDLVIGFAGAPGHQRLTQRPLGDYGREIGLVDRWDPVTADIGGAWDLLLQYGFDVWGAGALSDFHSRTSRHFSDYWPGEFSETWIYAPDRSAAGVLRALRAGSFFGVHGHIARSAELSVMASGLPRPAVAGEWIEVPPGTPLTVALDVQIPEVDAAGRPNRIDEIELIGITRAGARSLVTRPPAVGGPALVEQIVLPAGGLVVRARGRRAVENEPDLLFYTNPVRISTSD